MKIWPLLVLTAAVAAHDRYCRCECGTNTLVNPIDRCGQCTLDYCTGLKNLCPKGTDESTILISCFSVESYKEQFIIVVFVLAVVALLVLGYWK